MLNGKRGWLAVTAIVMGYELLAPPGELLSEQVDKWILSHPFITRGFILLIGLHLSNGLPSKWDPVHQAGYWYVKTVRKAGVVDESVACGSGPFDPEE